MGYACPVCEVPQQDAEHLANHLAFTALLHEDDHADWLDESVPDWREGGPEDLAPEVADLAEESDYDAVFEDTTDDHDHGGHDHGQAGHRQAGHDLGIDPATAGRQAESAELDAEAQSVLQEARAMTREMVSGDETPTEETGDGETRDDETPTEETTTAETPTEETTTAETPTAETTTAETPTEEESESPADETDDEEHADGNS